VATNTDRTTMPMGEDAALMALRHDLALQGMGGSPSPSRSSRSSSAPEPTTESPGTLMDAPADEVFRVVDELVVRQEPLAISRLHQDRHWTNLKLGRIYSTLEKVEGTNQYRQSFPPGMEELGLRAAAVPNKTADLANKLTETLLVDLPKPNPEPTTDSEQAERGARMLREYLTQDGGEAGTNDGELFWAQVEGATARSSTFNHYWVDPSGGFSIPRQLKAHPQATDPAHPLDAQDPVTGQMVPTTDYILRYVTPQGQFTPDPSHADRQWVPRLKIEKWGREHWRLYPEDQDLHGAHTAIGLLYCTLGEARRRWPAFRALTPEEQGAISDWLPRRHLALLPHALRARWIKDGGKANDVKGASHDERLLFYYAYYRKADPDYPKGAFLYVNGADGGTLLAKDTLVAEVEVPSEDEQDQLVLDTRHLDLPLVQIRLLQDTDEKDPMGKSFLARIAGAGEASAQLVGAYLEAMDTILHPARFATSTSPLDHEVVEESRAMGKFAEVLSRDDFPQYEEPRPLPPNFWIAVDWLYEQMDSSASQNKPLQGSDTSKEVSGKARQIAVNQAMMSMSRMQQAVNHAWERHWRIKAQLLMKHATVPQLLRYVGEDGASKQEWFTGNDFASVGGITVAAGTGTMLPPQEKVNYTAQLVQLGFMTRDEAEEAARPAFVSTLGIPENPHQQRIERQVSSWRKGPPGGWVEQYRAYAAQKQAYDAEQARATQAREQQRATATQTAERQARETETEAETQRATAAETQRAQLERERADRSGAMEQAKAEQSLMLEREKHQMAMEAKERDGALAREQAEVTAAASTPPPPPEIIVEAPDLAPIANVLEKIEDVLVALAQREPPAPVVQTAPPTIHVHPAKAPDVRVEAPVVHIAAPLSASEPRAIPLPARQRGKRKGKITGPDGQEFTIETTGDTEE
jgi:hypothetical protein